MIDTVPGAIVRVQPFCPKCGAHFMKPHNGDVFAAPLFTLVETKCQTCGEVAKVRFLEVQA